MLVVVVVGASVVVIAAIAISLLLYLRQRNTRLKLEETEALYGAKQDEDYKKSNKKNWKSRLITRKTIR